MCVFTKNNYISEGIRKRRIILFNLQYFISSVLTFSEA